MLYLLILSIVITKAACLKNVIFLAQTRYVDTVWFCKMQKKKKKIEIHNLELFFHILLSQALQIMNSKIKNLFFFTS